ncbi:M50 family metallopeptidase [Streptomyces palmae]|uniref:M50 family peptidase n=1 Tax=Streptomyces palmae TaxID=1701085 RepID=A0A4Z0HDG4_9ACTN|nr:M50 family metallopeptidase [Streptomyces palmae]TGB16627.1 M50 family peptidase [Streptomyces palmae]
MSGSDTGSGTGSDTGTGPDAASGPGPGAGPGAGAGAGAGAGQDYRRPRLRSDVVLGPGLRSGPKVLHHIKDERTGCYYRIGAREHFIMGLMDGSRTLDDIGRAYEDTYQRRLGPANWQQIFTLLGRYQLLDGHTDPAVLDRLRAAHEEKQAAQQNWLHRRWVMMRPDGLCAVLAQRLSVLFHRAFVIPALLVLLALQIYVWSRFDVLIEDTGEQNHWAITVPLSLLLAWLITMGHELAHGVSCRYFGGRVTEIGVRWRFPFLAPYCRTDDIVLFQRRTARVATAFAGSFVSLLAMIPVAVWWRLTEDGHQQHALAAALLLFGSGGALVNMLPFFQLDGYVMLTHALGIADLRRDATTWWRLRLTSRKPTAQEQLAAYPAREARIYAGYGAASALFLTTAYAALMWLWFRTLDHWMPAGWAVAILAAETAVLAGVVALAAKARTRGERTHG